MIGKQIENVSLLLLDVLVHFLKIGATFTNVVHAIITWLLKIPSDKLMLLYMSQPLEPLISYFITWSRQMT